MSAGNKLHVISSAADRRQNATSASQAGVRESSVAVYARKWKQFCDFCNDQTLQEGSNTLDPNGSNEPTDGIVGKTMEYFHYKVVEMGCDPGEVINIRSALSSVYKRRFNREGTWNALPDGTTQGNPMNALLITESIQFYKRRKKEKGYKRALPFRYRYMKRMWEYANQRGCETLQSVFVMSAASMCFTLWLRIDELVKLKWRDVDVNAVNEDDIPCIKVTMRDRKFNRSKDGQVYALYEQVDEPCACAFKHLKAWVKLYREMLGRPFIGLDPLFPHADEEVAKISYGENMNQQCFMKTINNWVDRCDIMPRNIRGDVLGRFSAHCFRRGGAQHRFITGKNRWPLDVVKWWGGWGTGDDVNTIIRYLLEETWKYENNYTHYLYTHGSDAEMLSGSVRATPEDIGRELGSLRKDVRGCLTDIDKRLQLQSQELSSLLSNIIEYVTRAKIVEPVTNAHDDGADCHAGSESRDITPEKEVRNTADERKCTHIPRVRSWREVLTHWNEGCREKNLLIPLKDWPSHARKSSFKSKYHDRKLIAEEYETVGEAEFLFKYNPDDISISKLKNLIRTTRRPEGQKQ